VNRPGQQAIGDIPDIGLRLFIGNTVTQLHRFADRALVQLLYLIHLFPLIHCPAPAVVVTRRVILAESHH
jgi:hypothetical protein